MCVSNRIPGSALAPAACFARSSHCGDRGLAASARQVEGLRSGYETEVGQACHLKEGPPDIAGERGTLQQVAFALGRRSDQASVTPRFSRITARRSDLAIGSAFPSVDPTPFYARYGDNAWAAVKAYLDTASDQAAAPIIEKYRGVLAAADVFVVSTAFVILESMRLDLGVGIQIHP
jgi:hypothetical protein